MSPDERIDAVWVSQVPWIRSPLKTPTLSKPLKKPKPLEEQFEVSNDDPFPPRHHDSLLLSCLPWSLGVAADNLDLFSRDRILVIQLEIDVFDQERPDFIAEAVGVQVTLGE